LTEGLGLVLGLVLLAGCSESLFGTRHAAGGDDGGSGDDVPAACAAPCIADAAADFDGSLGGLGNHWRYLDDRRDRNWIQMMASGGEMTGAGGNRITTCAAHPDAPACAALPGALLVSSAGATSNADPAIEFTASTTQVIQLSLRALVPSGADQVIRLYRNSREDVLFTGTATAGATLAQAITLDALPGDRFLVAVAPTGKGATDVAVQLFASARPTPFPSSCQLALRFENITGFSTTDLLCLKGAYTHLNSQGNPTSITLGSGPFLEQGNAIKIPDGTSFHDYNPTDALDYAHDVTVQFWALQLTPSASTAWLFSDLDVTRGGGVGISILPGAPAMLEVTAGANPAPSFVHASATYPNPGSWQFIRVVHTSVGVQVCVNGDRAMSLDADTTNLATGQPPDLGKDVQDVPAAASFDGLLDDVRVITGALPCAM